ncbi:MAG: hypothetical protein E3K29_08615 [Candidatus Brocadia sp.]|nr:hypothetical protein [Candidatus Brocadia sp.]
MLKEYLDFFCRVDEVFAAEVIALLLSKSTFVFLKGKPDPPKGAPRLSGGGTAILSLLSASPLLQAIHASWLE